MEYSASRKKDYIAVLAVFLFVLIFAGEVIFVLLLSRQLDSPEFWEKEVSREEMLELEDVLRADILKLKREDEIPAPVVSEAELMGLCLNELADYLREYRSAMTGKQVGQVYSRLLSIEEIYDTRWKKSLTCEEREDYDIDGFLEICVEGVNEEAAGGKALEEGRIYDE